MKNIAIFLVFTMVMACSRPQAPKQALDFEKMIQPVSKSFVLKSDDYWIWGASMVRTDDDTCHLFFSRWPKSDPFNSWVLKSEIAYATAPNPEGPYSVKGVVLKGRGTGRWDALNAHNPHIKKFGDKYYLYFVSQDSRDFGMGEWQNAIFSQRIGVAVADSPTGPWTISETPLIDIQEGKAAHGYVTNPSVCQGPDGTYLMIFKSRPENWAQIEGFTSVQCVATAPAPDGPFTIAAEPILSEATAEDPFLWFQDGSYYAIVDDQYGDYIGYHGLALFQSADGINWKASEHPVVSKVQIAWDDSTITKLNHLERPQLWFDKDGRPAMLFCAAQELGSDSVLRSYNVHIKLKSNETK